MIARRVYKEVLFAVLVAASLGAGCRGWTTEETPVVPIRNMYQQPRYDAQEESSFFEDGRSMRPAIEGTVSREMGQDRRWVTGRNLHGDAWLMTYPDSLERLYKSRMALLKAGQKRYGIYCAPCHSEAGDGGGIIARRAQDLGESGFMVPTFHDERLRELPDGQIFATISNGVRNMPAYRHSIPVRERWAIVAYVRALQLTQVPIGAGK